MFRKFFFFYCIIYLVATDVVMQHAVLNGLHISGFSETEVVTVG